MKLQVSLLDELLLLRTGIKYFICMVVYKEGIQISEIKKISTTCTFRVK